MYNSAAEANKLSALGIGMAKQNFPRHEWRQCKLSCSGGKRHHTIMAI
jgi:hypothetical protein